MPDYASSVQGLGLRVTKLTSTGAPSVGAENAFFTKAFTKVGFTPEYTEGEEIETKAADGSVCVYYKMPDILKQVALEVAICNPDPELYEMLAGGTLLEETGETVGWQSAPIGVDPNPNGVGLDVWSRAVVGGRPAAVNPYFRWLFPYAKLRLEGERALENGAMAHVFQGIGFGNENWGDGPTGDWPFPDAQAMQYVRTNTLPSTVGYVAVVADA